MSIFSQSGTGGADVATQEQLVEQISQLHLLVQEMKDGFTGALQELASIQRDDQALEQKIEENKNECRQEISEIAQMVRELKDEFSKVQDQLQVTTESQQSLKEQVEYLQYERDILLEELEKSGSISEKLRKSHQKQSFPPEVTENDHSDANVDNLRELKDKNEINGNHVSRPGDRGDGESNCSQPLSPPSYSKNIHTDFTTTDDNQNYESDSSITHAATLSLTLSKSLHNKCVKSHLSSDEEEQTLPNGNQQINQDGFQLNRNEGSGASRNSSFGGHDTVMRRLSTPSKELIAKTKRQEIALDILETEKKYVSCLSILEKHFAVPLRQSSILPARDVNAIFPAYLSVFYQRHQVILKQIEERVHNRKYEGMLGDVFARLADPSSSDLLQCYSNYVTDFPNSIDMINHWNKQSQKFRKFLKKQLTELDITNIGLATYLLAPLQRIPKYVLLLQQMLKYTEEDNPDYYYMQSAIQGLNDFINNMNTAIEDAFKILNNSRQGQSKQRSSLDKLRRYRFHRKSANEEKRHSADKYSPEDGEKMTLSFHLNTANPVETQIRRRRKDKSHGRSRQKALSVGQDETGRITPNSNLYGGPSRSMTDTQLNITAATGESLLPQTLSMYSYQSLPEKDSYAMQYPSYNANEQQTKGSSFLNMFDDSKYSSARYLELTPPEQHGEHNGQINGTGYPVVEPQMNISYGQSDFAKPKHKSDKPRGLPKRPSFGIYGNRDEDSTVYIPSKPGQGLSRKEQYRLQQLRQQQQQNELQYQQEQGHQSYSPVSDSPSPITPTGSQEQRYQPRPTSRTPISTEYMNLSYSHEGMDAQRASTPSDELSRPQVVTGVWDDDRRQQRKK
ncbi:rho guanine nucleotide exchange factor 33-like isoform X2 [Ptychodera flava]|uniref:rho guanine nucleotide exchange factor 33-like isoform X2 n=1 Tax=Ptychodera flava TaxID=63121 RepID=UPI003969CC11